MHAQQKRVIWRSGFFLLFILAPPLDLFRFDLIQNHFIILGYPWTLGIESFQTGQISSAGIAWNMFLRFFLPLGIIIGGGIFISWKWGRLYCGWLCPHFSVVETINSLMRRASGKLSFWDKKTLPEHQSDGKHIASNAHWWLVVAFAVLGFSFLWAVVLLTYLLPPKEIYSNLFSANLTRYQFAFIGVATALLVIEFTLARHLFCRFGCAIGIFQSLVWMGNKKAMVVSFDRQRAKECLNCDSSCEHACPMRLKPRSTKRHMFTCTQCMQCVEACENVQSISSNTTGVESLSLLKMLEDQCALDTSARDFGKKPEVPDCCYGPENKDRKSCV
jgi:ferredoxin-type protein NapH